MHESLWYLSHTLARPARLLFLLLMQNAFLTLRGRRRIAFYQHPLREIFWPWPTKVKHR
jgi:hypothetical protein